MTTTPIYDQLSERLTRSTDPLTSVLAAEQVTDVLDTKAIVLEILRGLGPLPDEWIHREHTRLARNGHVPRLLSPQRIRTVRAQLVDDGLVEDSEQYIKLPGARCTSTVWKATNHA